jgi:hypothetical protein
MGRNRGSVLGIEVYILSRVLTCYWGLISPCLLSTDAEIFREIERPGRDYIYLHLVLRLRMSGSIPLALKRLNGLTRHRFTLTFATSMQAI